MRLIGSGSGIVISGNHTRSFASYIWECGTPEKAAHNCKALEQQGYEVVASKDGRSLTMRVGVHRCGAVPGWFTLYFSDIEATTLALIGEGVAISKQYTDGKCTLEMSQSDPPQRPRFGINSRGPYMSFGE